MERINKAQGLPINAPFKREYSLKLYKEALEEIEKNGEKGKKKTLAKKDIKWEKLIRLSPKEYEKVISRHPELSKEEK